MGWADPRKRGRQGWGLSGALCDFGDLSAQSPCSWEVRRLPHTALALFQLSSGKSLVSLAPPTFFSTCHSNYFPTDAIMIPNHLLFSFMVSVPQNAHAPLRSAPSSHPCPGQVQGMCQGRNQEPLSNLGSSVNRQRGQKPFKTECSPQEVRGLPLLLSCKESACNAGDPVSIPGHPLQYSCLENPMDRRAWWATVHGVARVGHDLATKPPPPPPQEVREWKLLAKSFCLVPSYFALRSNLVWFNGLILGNHKKETYTYTDMHRHTHTHPHTERHRHRRTHMQTQRWVCTVIQSLSRV